MEPNYPGNENNNPVQQPQPAMPTSKKRWPFSRKMTIILAAVLVVIVAALFMVLGATPDDKSSSDRAALYTQRPGYENLDGSIGDPMALISKPSNKIAQYKGQAVVQPCTVLNVEDIRETGLKLTPSLQPGAVTSIYLDGQSQLPIQPQISDFGFPFPDDTNSCTYYLTNGERVTLTVYQSTYASTAAIDREISRNFTPMSAVDGVETFQKRDTAGSDAESTTYLLRTSGVTGVLQIKTANNTAKNDLLPVVASHMKTAVNTSTPVQEYAYESPIWTGQTAKPCALFDASAVKTILGKEAGPLVEEKVGGAIGVVKHPSTEALYNYLSGECSRRTAEKNTADSQVIVQTDTFETEEGAKAIYDYTTKGNFTKNLQEISPAIGDQAFYADTAGMEEAVVFRKGRVVVKMTFVSPLGSPKITANDRIKAMRPAAEIAVDRLKDF